MPFRVELGTLIVYLLVQFLSENVNVVLLPLYLMMMMIIIIDAALIIDTI